MDSHTLTFPLVVSSYREGYIRLVGGDYNWEGRVEIFYSGTWSTISDTSWTSSDATVVCRQLRHSTSTEGELYFVSTEVYVYTTPCIILDMSGAHECQVWKLMQSYTFLRSFSTHALVVMYISDASSNTKMIELASQQDK